MNTYTIYENPRDYPGHYVARRWVVGNDNTLTPDPEPLIVARNVAKVRLALLEKDPNLICLGRTPGDDPAVLEVWL